MDIGCLFPPSMRTPEFIRVAEECGYSRALLYDSPAFLADPWITLARAADMTSEITLGISALTPRLRHVVATAGAIATLHAIAPGRVEIVVGSGFTSQLMIGQKPCRWSEVEAFVVALKRLLRGEDIPWEGATIGLRHGRLTGIELPIDVPIRVAAHGPKGYDVGQRVADGVVTNPGHHQANDGPVDPSRALVLYYGTVLEPGEDAGSDRVLDAAGPYAAFQLHIGAEGMAGDSPERIRFDDELSTIDADVRHLELHRGHLSEVTDRERPIITGDLIRATTGTGTIDEVSERLTEIERSGVEGVLYGPMGPDTPRELRAFAAAAQLARTTAPA